MLKARQVGVDGDSGFGMAAISEDWPSPGTWPRCSTPVQRVIPNITARGASRSVRPRMASDWELRVFSIRVIGAIGERRYGRP